MGRFLDALMAGVSSYNEPRKYEVAKRPVRCPHCGESLFVDGRALLNTPGLTFMNLDWANRSATILVCSECGRIEWFAREPRERPAPGPQE
jgi:DNA-directed RNA polymerase subunit RPC12/RpoP